MTRPTTSCARRINGGQDSINRLPDELLSFIISFLSIGEAVRSSAFSKRWKPLWKYASCLNFDVKSFSGNFDEFGTIVSALLCSHLGELTSCCFRHLPMSLDSEEVESWVEIVVEKYKSLSSLILECVPLILHRHQCRLRPLEPYFKSRVFSNLCSLELINYRLNSSASFAFEGCEKLKTLKLEKMFMEDKTLNGILDNCLNLEKLSLIESKGFMKLKIQNSRLKFLELVMLVVNEIDVFVEGLQVFIVGYLVCLPAGVRIYAPNLRSFQSIYKAIDGRFFYNSQERLILKTQDILEICSDLYASRTTNIFQTLFILSIDLDLNNIREALALSFILRSCLYLETLKITIPVNTINIPNFWDDSNDCELPFPKSIFWDREEVRYNCINFKLKFATIEGFTGKEQEVKFAKHLITRATMMEKISIICDSTIVDEARDLLSLPIASSNHLSIILKSEKEVVQV